MSQQNTTKRIPVKHAEVIKAWADGADIEWRIESDPPDSWRLAVVPVWREELEYRVKSETVYSHTFTMAFTVETTRGADAVSGDQLHEAAMRHISDLGTPREWRHSCDLSHSCLAE